ncbi:lipopolysaccharide biosynthesis protein [Alteromonas oceanisediminis]|uniref:lipopolysaccharide biosynthesis protein n=1 Tax=Alteromonas oceanisediminis TaxID=2836180 RepID=UPI001BD98149|nr:polysaccharide biosynthesis protein [Alteromonas oceanisediminis]MBT0587777.1 polysaccharide biosynthesis protein [Alteromonas oceanisediminis]
MANTLATNSTYTLLANTALAASNWLVLVLITKYYLPAQLGSFVLALSIFSPAFLLASFKVRTLLIVDKQWAIPAESYAAARLLANICVTTLILAIIPFVFTELPIAVLALVALYKFGDAWSEFCHSYLRRADRFKIIAISTVLRATFTVLALITASTSDIDFYTVLVIWVSATCVFSAIDTMLFRHHWSEPVEFSFHAIVSKTSMRNALAVYQRYYTVSIALLIGALFVHAPNYALAHFDSTSAAGIFATISYFLIAGGILINSLSQAATPHLVNSISQGNHGEFNRTIVKLCLLGIGLGLTGIFMAFLLGEWVLTLFYTPQIATYWPVLVWVMVAAAIRYVFIFLGTGLAALQRFAVQTRIAVAGFVCLVIALWLCVPLFGLFGAAYAMIIAALVECSLYLLLFQRQTRTGFSGAIGRT